MELNFWDIMARRNYMCKHIAVESTLQGKLSGLYMHINDKLSLEIGVYYVA